MFKKKESKKKHNKQVEKKNSKLKNQYKTTLTVKDKQDTGNIYYLDRCEPLLKSLITHIPKNFKPYRFFYDFFFNFFLNFFFKFFFKFVFLNLVSVL